MPSFLRKSIEFAPGKTLELETGRLAKQAGGSVVVRQGDTLVLVTATLSPDVREGQSFFPLTVEYREKYAAGGKIPGGFMKREGRPSDKEILSARLTDRPIRPLFPDGFLHEVQVIANVLSADPAIDSDVLAATGASAALLFTGAPFAGPIASVRVARVDGAFVVNPTFAEREGSDFDLVVAGKADALVMVEGEMKEVSEDDMLAALDTAHEAIKKLCAFQTAFVEEAGAPAPMQYTSLALPDGLVEAVRAFVEPAMAAHVRQPYGKATFYDGVGDLTRQTIEHLLGVNDPNTGATQASATEQGWTKNQIKEAVGKVEADVLREMVLADGKRLDGRSTTDIRDIWCEVGYLPRVHGSAVFTRGETQVLASVTLGTKKDGQLIDQLFASGDKRFMLHYSFPPFSTGEAKPIRGLSRRETGHGMLAERALGAMMPGLEDFPYTVRINADVLESNGSSSMASVCSGSLALMDAGVPLEKPVAGIAMGLISDGARVAILSDILGTEDHLGDMDFKLCGTRDGITACQMDIKIDGLSRDVMRDALLQAKAGREHILGIMEATLAEPREDLSPFAPRLTQIQIDTEFIGAVIGPGGKIIQGIQRETNTKIEIEERDGFGFVTIAAVNGDEAAKAIAIIKGIVSKPEPGEQYEGTVKNLLPFGAIVEILPGKEGMLHVSEMDWGYVEKPEDFVQVGDRLQVQVIEVRDDGKVRLTRKPFVPKPEPGSERARPPRAEGDRGGDRGGYGGRGGDRDRGGRGDRRDGGGGRGGDRDRGGYRGERGGDRPRGDRDGGPRAEGGDRPSDAPTTEGPRPEGGEG